MLPNLLARLTVSRRRTLFHRYETGQLDTVNSTQQIDKQLGNAGRQRARIEHTPAADRLTRHREVGRPESRDRL